jgi:sugar-specific transcriptional regulator TrmB
MTPLQSGVKLRMTELIEQLTAFGLTRYEASVYLTLLERQDFTPTQVATEAKVPRQRIYDVLASLCRRGMCSEGHNGQRTVFRAVDPTIALNTLATERERQRESERVQQIEQITSLTTLLAPLFAAGNREDDPLAYIDVISQSHRIAERAFQMAQNSEREIRVCFKRPAIVSDADNLRMVREPLTRGLVYRTLYERRILDDLPSRELVRQCIAWGQQARFLDDVPVKMQLHDDKVALLSLQDPLGGEPRFTAIAVTNLGLTQLLSVAFESLWERAETVGEFILEEA